MSRLLGGFYRLLLVLAALFMIATLVVIILGIAGRQFNFDVPGLDAYAGYSIAAALFLALPGTLRNGDHIRVTLVFDRLKGAARTIAEYWCLVAATGVCVYLAYFSARLVWMSHLTHDVSPSMDMTPLWIPQIAMAVGAIGLAVAFVEELVLKLIGQEIVIAPAAEMARVE